MIYEISGAGQSATMESTGAYSNVYEHWKRGHWYELPLLEYWATLDAPDVFIDVGAHAGNHTVWAGLAWPGAEIRSLEPNSVPYKALVVNIVANDVRNAAPHRAAAWREKEWLSTSPSDVDEGMCTVVPCGTTPNGDTLLGIPVDFFCFGNVNHILIKIDAESDNAPILRGATRLLKENDCRLFIECATDADHKATGDVLREMGYEWTGKVWGATPMYEAVKA